VRFSVAISRIAFIGLIVALWPAADAAAGGLYSAQVPVNSQSEAERSEALKSALGQVVIRISGDPGALAKSEVAKAVANAEHYVQQYQYQQEVVTNVGQLQTRTILVAQFDRAAVDKLLQGLGLMPGDAAGATSSGAAEVADTTPGSYRIWVGGVRSAQDYARLIGALSGNELVHEVQVEQVRGDGLQLQLGVAGSLQRLLDSLSKGSVVRVTNAHPPVEGTDALLDMQSQ